MRFLGASLFFVVFFVVSCEKATASQSPEDGDTVLLHDEGGVPFDEDAPESEKTEGKETEDTLLFPDVPAEGEDAVTDEGTAGEDALLTDSDEDGDDKDELSIILNDNPRVPLAAVGTLKTAKPVTLRVTITSSEGTRSAEIPSPPAPFPRFPVLGLFPGVANTVSVEKKKIGGAYEPAGEPVTLEAPPLPDDFPPITVRSADPDAMDPGWTLLNISRSPGTAQSDKNFGCLLAAVDAEGRVGWYFRDSGDCYDFALLPDGRLMIQFIYRLIVTDLLGETQQAWHPENHVPLEDGSIPVAVDVFHHAVTLLPWGNWLALDNDRRMIENWPTSETDPSAPPQTTVVTGDEIVEFTPTGEVVKRWNLFDLLDPYRIGYTSIRMFKQWTHANAVYYDESDDTIVVSLRNQSVVVKIGYDDGNLHWLLGPHDYWKEPWSAFLLTPVGTPFQWNYYQHAPKRLPDGTILMFDNGAYRAFPYDPMFPAEENGSRAVIFAIDEDAMTVSQMWDWNGDGEKIYAPYLSDADLLPATGNVLIVFGGITTDEAGTPTDDLWNCKVSARVIEVTRGETPERKVFDLEVADPAPDMNGWRIYRGARHASLYGSGT